MTVENPKISIIILAAGVSQRLGTPKQLLKFRNKTLIRRIAETALSTSLKTFVVLGANAEKISSEIKNLPLEIVLNNEWQTGMSSSIKTGLSKVLEASQKTEAVIFLLCDQPFVDAELILKLVEIYKQTQKKIVACGYENTVGVPALFSCEMFGDLLNLKGDKGARFLIGKYSDITKINAPEAAVDIDTIEDYQKLIEEKFR